MNEVNVNFEEIIAMAKTELSKNKTHVENYDLNVLIAGSTGVGKSTLINTVFGKKVALTGQGAPITQQITKYSLENGLSIYDTKGLEMKDFEATKGEIESFLGENKAKSADEQIHIAWLCLSEDSRRLQDGEIELYKMLKAYGIPTIVVVTKAERDKDPSSGERFSDFIKNELGLKESEFERVRALESEDDEGVIKKIMGVDLLINKTFETLPQAKSLAFARQQEYDKEMRELALKRLREKAKEEAEIITHSYASIAAGIAASPLPFSDIALLLPTQVGMILHIAKAYELEMNAESAKKLIIALGAVAGTGFAVRAALGTALKFIPGAGSLAGGMINGTVAAATTEMMGQTFIAYLDDNFSNLSEAIKNIGAEALKKYANA